MKKSQADRAADHYNSCLRPVADTQARFGGRWVESGKDGVMALKFSDGSICTFDLRENFAEAA